MVEAELSVAQHTLQHRLQDIPPSTLPHIKVGFTLLGKVEPSKLIEVVDYVVGNFSRRSRFDPDEAAAIAGIDKNIVGDMLSAIAITVGSVFDIEVNKDDFFNLVPESLIDENTKPYVDQVLDNIIARKASIRVDVDRYKIANAVLPSYRRLDSEIDLRFKFDDNNEIIDKAPVAVIYIDTDATEEIWFQVSILDLDKMIDKLEKTRLRLQKITEIEI